MFTGAMLFQANIHSIMGSEDQVLNLMRLLDEGIQEAERIEDKLNSYDQILAVSIYYIMGLAHKYSIMGLGHRGLSQWTLDLCCCGRLSVQSLPCYILTCSINPIPVKGMMATFRIPPHTPLREAIDLLRALGTVQRVYCWQSCF